MVPTYVNALPDDNSLHSSKLKGFADNKIDIIEFFFSGKGRKQFRKLGKCWIPAFPPFGQLFSKCLILGLVKTRDSLVNGKA